MKNQKRGDAQSVIVTFLLKTPAPVTADWKRLIDENPEFASDIAQAAMEGRGVHANVESDALSADEQAVYDRTISKVLNLVHSGTSAVLDEAQAKIQAVKGPAVREVAKELGLGVQVALMNRVLAGRTRAPRRVAQGIAKKFDIALPVLGQVLARNFARAEVPAYKATDGKPQVAAEPQSWADAVAELQLSKVEAEALLALDEETGD